MHPSTDLVTHADRDRLLSDVEAHLREGRGFTLATLNLDHLVKLRRDPAFHDAYRAHSHVVADGNPVVWLSRLAGRRVELVPGSELIQPLAALAAQTGSRVALLGSTEPVLTRAANALAKAHPGLQVVLCHAPPFGFDPTGASAEDAIAALRAANVDLCFLALGAPKQEIFATHAAPALPGCGFVSIGAGLDFIAGGQRRAPKWVQAVAMEWFWRMAGNPRRLARRYAACFAILPSLGLQAIRSRSRQPVQKDG
ncbi:WecB/TagA/CpsF family glycosyltransferase [Paracoccus albicereus]|nr:WecB/TagA/CpsF family glycosyltransferase [Paracoccus albicereus]